MGGLHPPPPFPLVFNYSKEALEHTHPFWGLGKTTLSIGHWMVGMGHWGFGGDLRAVQTFFFFFLVQTKMSWRTLLTGWYSGTDLLTPSLSSKDATAMHCVGTARHHKNEWCTQSQQPRCHKNGQPHLAGRPMSTTKGVAAKGVEDSQPPHQRTRVTQQTAEHALKRNHRAHIYRLGPNEHGTYTLHILDKPYLRRGWGHTGHTHNYKCILLQSSCALVHAPCHPPWVPIGGVPCAVRKVGCSPPPGVR